MESEPAHTPHTLSTAQGGPTAESPPHRTNRESGTGQPLFKYTVLSGTVSLTARKKFSPLDLFTKEGTLKKEEE